MSKKEERGDVPGVQTHTCRTVLVVVPVMEFVESNVGTGVCENMKDTWNRTHDESVYKTVALVFFYTPWLLERNKASSREISMTSCH